MTFPRYNHDVLVNEQYFRAKKYNKKLKDLVELNKQCNLFSENTFHDRRCKHYLKEKIKDIRTNK